MTAPTVTLRKIPHYLGDDPVPYGGKTGARTFKPRAYEVLVDGEIVGAIENGTGSRETRSAGRRYVNMRWAAVEWSADFARSNGRTRSSSGHRTRTDALAVVLAYGARLGDDGSGPSTPNDVRPLAKAARVAR